jgi:hypothetical protein
MCEKQPPKFTHFTFYCSDDPVVQNFKNRDNKSQTTLNLIPVKVSDCFLFPDTELLRY